MHNILPKGKLTTTYMLGASGLFEIQQPEFSPEFRAISLKLFAETETARQRYTIKETVDDVVWVVRQKIWMDVNSGILFSVATHEAIFHPINLPISRIRPLLRRNNQ